MYGKIQISGTIEVITGMHIGGSNAFAAIGAVDNPIIKDARTNLPMIPGSSLKGKMRSLLAKEYNTAVVEHNDDCEQISRLFGSSKKTNNKIRGSRLIFSDMILSNPDELRRKGAQNLTEIKFENSISRATAVANPRQMERAIRGSEFDLDIIYEVNTEDINEIMDDIRMLGEGLKLIQYDYIGGSGSRGYGKIKFKNISAKAVVGNVDSTISADADRILKEAVSD